MVQESLDRKKGIPDIVFLIDASGSMEECIQAVTNNVSNFVDTLAAPDANGGVIIKDWRICVIGYRDRDAEPSQWLVENPFTSDIGEVKAQLANLEAKGGGDEPESLFDAMYMLTELPSADKGAQALPNGWRHRHDAARIVVVFTDASSKNSFRASDGSTGTVDDLIQAYHASKLKVILFAPNAPCYSELSMMNGLEWDPVGAVGENPVQALKEFTSNSSNFRKVMEALAKSVSASATVPVL
jgi:Mg-chelatase subunit ChlD